MQRKHFLRTLGGLLLGTVLTATAGVALARGGGGAGPGGGNGAGNGAGGAASGAGGSDGAHGHGDSAAAAHSQGPSHMSEEGRENTNAQFLDGSTRGQTRAAERRSKSNVDAPANEKSEQESERRTDDSS